MKSLLFPNQNTLILLNKGGSTLIGWMIKLYCDWKGVPIIHNQIGKGKVIVVIRNPLHRHLSGFLHRYTITNPINWKGEDDMIEDFGKWMERCWNGEIETHPNDYHVWRASSIFKKEGIYPQTVIQIEEWGEEMKKWASIRRGAMEPEWEIPHSPIPSSPPPLLTEIGLECNGWDALMWAGLYHLSLQNVVGHHKEEGTYKLLHLLQRHPHSLHSLEKWVNGDMWKWGYQKMI